MNILVDILAGHVAAVSVSLLGGHTDVSCVTLEPATQQQVVPDVSLSLDTQRMPIYQAACIEYLSCMMIALVGVMSPPHSSIAGASRLHTSEADHAPAHAHLQRAVAKG